MLRSAAATLALLLSVLCIMNARPALADDGPVIGGHCEGESSWVTVCRQDPGTSSGHGKTPRASGKHSNGESKPRPQTCAVERLDPQPPASDPVWKGHKPGDGAIYARVCLGDVLGRAAGADMFPDVFWSPKTPAVHVDPEQLAREAVDRMLLTGPDIASPTPAGRYLVGMPVWMWVNRSPTTYGPNTASASLAGVTVTATAKVTKIDWNTGDGITRTCQGPGTKYTAAYGKQDSPTCGHTYTRTSASRQRGTFTVTATAAWTVDWQVDGAGESGQFTQIRQSHEQVAIGELQVVR
ncbi:ATP/GTP-binding protein [Streptomyces sp. NPDC047028]|uniref:ATP/GTP-binding protein n=1 Tax=Streptomyces sp. NPDC047028 TaxID=3155793 RepID=UPI0033CAAA21